MRSADARATIFERKLIETADDRLLGDPPSVT
jgi:hypothetical protein